MYLRIPSKLFADPYTLGTTAVEGYCDTRWLTGLWSTQGGRYRAEGCMALG
jgi:hypothetical protein